MTGGVVSPGRATAASAHKRGGAARWPTLLAFALGTASLAGWWALATHVRPGFVGDEYHHVPAIRGLAEGDWSAARTLPMPATFHWIAARVLSLSGGRGPRGVQPDGLYALIGPDMPLLRAINPALGVLALLLLAAERPRAGERDARPGRILRW
jgi:hypothetical protein